MDTTAFLREIYGEETPGFFPIWTRPGNKSAWFSNADNAAKYAEKTKKNTYFCIGLFEKSLGPHRNGREAETIAVTGLGLDIDILNPLAHEKQNIPPTIEDGLNLIKKTLPGFLPPTIITNSGYGLQAFWLYKEPWVFDDDDDRLEAKRLSVRFLQTFRLQASHKHWEVDALPSLCQLFRVLGTQNYKDEKNPRLVEVVEHNPSARYLPADFEDVLIADQAGQIKLGGSTTDQDFASNPLGLVINEHAEPPSLLLTEILEMDPKFATTYRKLRDKEKQDASFSSYDQSLANLAKSYGWTDQEICNLLIAFRRENAKDEKQFRKVLRVSYLNRTIHKAREAAPQTANVREVQQIANDLKTQAMNNPQDATEEEKQEKQTHIRDQLSRALKIKIEHIYKYLGDEPIFELVINNGQKVTLGSIANLINQNTLRQHLAAHCGVYLNRYKVPEWDAFATTLLSLVEPVETGTDTKDKEIIAEWVRYYWSSRGATEDAESAFVNDTPYLRNGKCYIFGRDLRGAMSANGDRYSAKELGFQLRALGAKQETVMFTLDDGNKRSSKSAYNVTSIVNRSEK
jgi:hypothetical protein